MEIVYGSWDPRFPGSPVNTSGLVAILITPRPSCSGALALARSLLSHGLPCPSYSSISLLSFSHPGYPLPPSLSTLLLPSPLSPDHPPLVSIQGHGEQMLSIPVAGTSRIDSSYLFSLHPGYECCPRTPRHLFRLLPGFESTCHLACASRHSASFVTSTPDSVFESGQGGSDTAPLSMFTPSWRSFRAECSFRAVLFA